MPFPVVAPMACLAFAIGGHPIETPCHVYSVKEVHQLFSQALSPQGLEWEQKERFRSSMSALLSPERPEIIPGTEVRR